MANPFFLVEGFAVLKKGNAPEDGLAFMLPSVEESNALAIREGGIGHQSTPALCVCL
jgi:hypothetical protein